jgi:putative ATP-dependent endonuclease of OLD family
MQVKVACITDRDLPPGEARGFFKTSRTCEPDLTLPQIEQHIASRKARDAQVVRTFVSDWWTLEYDLAKSGLARLVNIAVALAKRSRTDGQFPTGTAYNQCVKEAQQQYLEWKKAKTSKDQVACNIVEPLIRKQASKTEAAQALASLLKKSHVKDFRPYLPTYLKEAIDYATSASSP